MHFLLFNCYTLYISQIYFFIVTKFDTLWNKEDIIVGDDSDEIRDSFMKSSMLLNFC